MELDAAEPSHGANELPPEITHEAPPFERSPRTSRLSGGFAALHGRLHEMSDKILGARRGSNSLYDRWERRRSVAARGDRLKLLRNLHILPEAEDPVSGSGSKSPVPAGPAVTAFESYDYNSVRSQLRFEAEAADSAFVDGDMVGELLMRSVAPLILGIIIGILGVLSNTVAGALINLKNSWTLHLLNFSSDAVLGLGGVAAAYPVFALFCMSLSGTAAALTVWVAPAAAGSGIPQAKAELNGVRVPGALATTTLVVKLVGVTLVVASGLPCGREGPMVQLGAGVASLVLRGSNRILSLACRKSALTEGPGSTRTATSTSSLTLNLAHPYPNRRSPARRGLRPPRLRLARGGGRRRSRL